MIRPKWHVESRNVRKGDVVLIQDSNAVRREWKLGIVSETFPGKDDRVRRVNFVYKNLPAQEELHHYKGTKYTTMVVECFEPSSGTLLNANRFCCSLDFNHFNIK